MNKILACIRLLRPMQWTKNVFVVAPLIFGFKLTDAASVTTAIFAFLTFCFLSSIVYIINDWRDIDADKKHSTKKKRPLASGAVSLTDAVMLILLLVALIVNIYFYAGFPPVFWIFPALYILFSMAYNFGLRQVPLLELFVVAQGYVLRLLAGCAALNEMPTPWILAASGTIALLIVVGKRRAEVDNDEPDATRKSLKAYNLEFLDAAIIMLATTTMVTYLLFSTSDYAIERYQTHYFVATSIFVLFGIMRYLQLVKTTTGAGDPTTLVLTDKPLLLTMIAWLGACIGFIYWR